MNKKLIIILILLLSHYNTLQAQTNADTNLIIRKDWGLCFTKCSNWIITSDAKKTVVLYQTTGRWTGDQITIDYVTGDSIRDDDVKFGWITYYYSNSKKKWMKKFPDESGNTDTIFHQPADTLAVLADGFPMFNGTGRWATSIIALSHTTFLKCNVKGSGLTSALFLMTGTIRKIK